MPITDIYGRTIADDGTVVQTPPMSIPSQIPMPVQRPMIPNVSPQQFLTPLPQNTQWSGQRGGDMAMERAQRRAAIYSQPIQNQNVMIASQNTQEMNRFNAATELARIQEAQRYHKMQEAQQRLENWQNEVKAAVIGGVRGVEKHVGPDGQPLQTFNYNKQVQDIAQKFNITPAQADVFAQMYAAEERAKMQQERLRGLHTVTTPQGVGVFNPGNPTVAPTIIPNTRQPNVQLVPTGSGSVPMDVSTLPVGQVIPDTGKKNETDDQIAARRQRIFNAIGQSGINKLEDDLRQLESLRSYGGWSTVYRGEKGWVPRGVVASMLPGDVTFGEAISGVKDQIKGALISVIESNPEAADIAISKAKRFGIELKGYAGPESAAPQPKRLSPSSPAKTIKFSELPQ